MILVNYLYNIYIYIYIYQQITATIYYNNPVEQFLINLKDKAFIKTYDMPVVPFSRNMIQPMQFCS
jgi:hypothetical protein